MISKFRSILIVLLGILAAIGLGKLFPKMMERCKAMCEKDGCNSSSCCQDSKGGCCGDK